jgi:hypothetical protein
LIELMTQPVFLVSLPRSGSTWLQTVIACSERVAASAEGWIMLPLIEAVCNGRGFSRYSQRTYRLAIASQKRRDPAFIDNLRAAAAAFAETFYREMAGGAPLFVDKTPRYSMICEELVEILPHSKMVILFRDPVDVARSIANTFGGRWNTLFRYDVDFVAGIAAMCRLARADKPNVMVFRYEDAIADRGGTTRRLSHFLGVELEVSEDLSAGRAKTDGMLGDPFAGKPTPKRPLTWGEAREISRLLGQISDEDLATMGYSRVELRQKLQSIPSHPSLRDPLSWVVKVMYRLGMAYVVEALFDRVRPSEKRIASSNDRRFGVE